MHLIEVDVVGLQASQRSLARVADVACGEKRVVGPVAHRAVELGGDHHLLAASPTLRETPAADLLGESLALLPAVDVRRLEEVEARIERRVHDLERRGFVGLRTEVHGAEAQAADGETGPTEVCVFHAAESELVSSIHASPVTPPTRKTPGAATHPRRAHMRAGRADQRGLHVPRAAGRLRAPRPPRYRSDRQAPR